MNSKDYRAMMADFTVASDHILRALGNAGFETYQMRFDSDPNGDDHYVTVSFRLTDVVREMADNSRGFSESYKVEGGKTVVLQAKSKEELLDMKQKMVKKAKDKDEDDTVEVELSPDELV